MYTYFCSSLWRPTEQYLILASKIGVFMASRRTRALLAVLAAAGLLGVIIRLRQTASMFGALLRNPRNVGEVLPTSRSTARKMARYAMYGATEDSLLVELGAGTGRITDALIGVLPHGARLVIFELDSLLNLALRRRYRHLEYVTVCRDASELLEILEGQNPHAVVSALPLANMDEELSAHILAQVAICLASGGRFVQIQYTKWKESLITRFFLSLDWRRNWANVPPARIVVAENPNTDAAKQLIAA
jgi:phosphatidylethanolamine/phosphatidyl-N-methylethanolamine N-methyltransferase